MFSTLASIDEFLKGRKISRLEKKRFERDIFAVWNRLRKREYKKGGFTTNVFDVPDRTREFYVYLEFYCLIGRTWAQILRQFDLSIYKTIVDLCPGYTPKVELALFYVNYSGEVIVMDKEPDSIKRLEDFMKLFEPKFNITRKKRELFHGRTTAKYDFIIANHIIDDLVVDYFADKMNIKKNDVYEKEGVAKGIWTAVLNEKEKNIEEILPKIVSVFSNLVRKNGYLLISQYKSYMEKLLDLDQVAVFNRRLFNLVVQSLCKKRFVSEEDKVKNAFQGFTGHFGSNSCFVLKKN